MPQKYNEFSLLPKKTGHQKVIITKLQHITKPLYTAL